MIDNESIKLNGLKKINDEMKNNWFIWCKNKYQTPISWDESEY